MGLLAFLGQIGMIFWTFVLFTLFGMEGSPPMWAVIGCALAMMVCAEFMDFTKPD